MLANTSRFLTMLLCAAVLVMSLGCKSKDLTFKSSVSDTISGSISSFSSMSAESADFSSQSTCLGKLASLYSLDDHGKKSAFLLETPIESSGSFVFSGLHRLGIDLSRESQATKYLIEFSCGTSIFQRFVTGTSDQNLSNGTTLMAWISLTDASALVRQRAAQDWIDFYQALERAGSLTEAFSTLNSNPYLTAKFQTIFGLDPSVLEDAVPNVKSTSVPTTFSEEIGQTMSVQATHWSHNYTLAYAWKLGSITLSNSSNFTFTPSANSQGSHMIQLFIGRDNGLGSVDTSKAYRQETFPILIQNSIPPVSPSVLLASPQYTSSLLATISMATGSLVDGRSQNCRSFSNLALVEESFPAFGIAPLLSSSYDIDCTTASQQDVNFNLSGTDGIRVMRLWARDAAGNISLGSQDVTLVLDRVGPSIALMSLNGGEILQGGSDAMISWTATEINPAGNPISIDYSTDSGSSWNSLAAGVSNSGSYNWTVPAIDSTTIKVRITMIDLAGNTGSVQSSTDLIIDSIPPIAPVIVRSSAQYSNSTSVAISVICDSEYAGILFSSSATAPLATDSGWTSCVSTMAFSVPSGDGAKTVYAYSKDSAGNISSSNSVTMTLDQTSPMITLTSFNSGSFKGGTTQTVTWTATDTNWGSQTIDIQYTEDNGTNWIPLAMGTANDASENFILPSLNTDQFQINVSGCDTAGNCASAISSASLTVDSTSPSLNPASMTINGAPSGSTPLSVSNYVQVSLAATDTHTNISHFCLKVGDVSLPALNATCWVAISATPPGLTPAKSLSLSNFNFLVGFTPGVNSIRAWVRDEVGNVSTLTNSGLGTAGQDLADVNYSQGAPPLVINVQATGSDTPSSPLAHGDINVSPAANLFIKWQASSSIGFDPTPISLYYTINDTTYVPIVLSIPNSSNGGCSTDGSHNGCYLWDSGVPVGSYFRIRVVATDLNGVNTASPSQALNSYPVNFLAGNLDPGINGSAASAVFFNDKVQAMVSDPQSFVVTASGVFYFRDVYRGILYVNPADGIQKLLIPTTGVASGDGGPISSATLKKPFKIALDSQERLLVFDDTKIRRIDTNANPMTITTIIGGGSSTSDIVAPLSAKINNPGNYATYTAAGQMPLIALPNGDIYFQSETTSSSSRVRVYRSTLDQVESIYPSGLGTYGQPSYDVSTCGVHNFTLSFDPISSALTSMQMVCYGNPSYPNVNLNPSTAVANGPHPANAFNNYNVQKVVSSNGKSYGFSKHGAKIYEFDSQSKTWNTLAGTGDLGSCNDGTPALSCKFLLYDVFISATGQIYFIDAGRLRTIDANGLVLTIFGQSLSFGDGGHPLSARFDRINSLDQSADTGPIVILDQIEYRMREFLIGGTISTIAGNGTNAYPNTSSPANTQPIVLTSAGPYWDDFRVDSNGNVYYLLNGGIGKLDRGTGKWSQLVGGGATNYALADGLDGSNIAGNGYPNVVIGYDGTNILSAKNSWNGSSHSDAFLKLYNSVTGNQSSLAGILGPVPNNSLCADGTPLSACAITGSYGLKNTRATWDTFSNTWLLLTNGTNSIRTLPPNGNIGTLTSLSSPASSFAYRRNAGLTVNIVYYCSTTDKKIHKKDINGATDIPLSWPVATIGCTGRSLIYNATRDSLIFPVEQGGLFGVVEYLSP